MMIWMLASTKPSMSRKRRLLASKGLPRALPLALLLATTSACGSPTSPSPPNVQGLWHGGWIATTCATTGAVPGSFDFCTLVSPLDVGEFVLGLTQSGGSLHGPVSVCYAGEFNIAGTIAADGTIALSGRVTTQTITVSSSVVNGTAMTGSFACTIVPSGGPTPGTIVTTVTGILKDVSLISRDPNAVP
jgi:hypothetical protein